MKQRYYWRIRKSLLQNYHNSLEESTRGSEFVPSGIDLLCYHLQRISLNRKGSSYIDSPKWLKNKKATVNPKNYGNNCFQYILTIALNHKQIKNHLERISNHKLFIDQYNWKGMNFPLQREYFKKFESNSKSVALNILFMPYNTEKIRLAYKSKYNFKHKNQVILLMITDTNGKKWHYLTVKSLSALLRWKTSNHDGDFYRLNCFHSYRTKEKLKKHEQVCNDYDCYVEMPDDDNKILKYNHGESH